MVFGRRALLPALLLLLTATTTTAQPYDPPLPPQYPASYTVMTIAQPYDHFNYLQPLPSAGATWAQRYLVNDTFWGGAGSPIVFYTGAEGTGVEAIFNHSGWIVDVLARNLSALFVMAEHRGFGVSNPWGPVDTFTPDAAHLGLLTLQQSMADYANLIVALRDQYSAWDSPLISVGGSLAGELSTWMRVRYPYLVDMALASSAPILGYPAMADQYGWNAVVADTFQRYGGDECVSLLRQGFWQVPALPLAALSSAFNTCTPADEYTAPYLVSMVWGWAGGAAEDSYPPVPSRHPVLHQCQVIHGSADGVEAFVRMLTVPGQCLNISNEPTAVPAAAATAAAATAAAATAAAATAAPHIAAPGPLLPGLGARRRLQRHRHRRNATNLAWVDTNGWDYLACTDEVHPIGTNNVTDFFPPSPWSLADTTAWCQESFGPLLVPRPLTLPTQFGLLSLPRFAASTSRIIFSSGSSDPWRSQSINATLSPTLPFVLIDQGAHHSDLGGPYNPVPDPETDTPSLVAARALEIEILNGWVREAAEERRRGFKGA
jgi:hypothetical protein